LKPVLKTGVVAALLAALSLSLAGCGSRHDELVKLTPPQLLTEAKKAAMESDTLKLKGDAGDVKIDLSYVGGKATGTMTVTGNTLQILSTGGATYFKASDAYWRSSVKEDATRVIELIHGRWIKIDPKDKNFEDLVTLASREKMVSEFLTSDVKVSAGKDRQIHGVDALGVLLGEDTLFINGDDARPLQLDDASKTKSTLRFSYGKVTVPKAPAKADVMTSAELLSAS
jgi:hypothetical protein